jgi:hypothetical protein
MAEMGMKDVTDPADDRLLGEVAAAWAGALEACREFRRTLEKAEWLREQVPRMEDHAAAATQAESALREIGRRLGLALPPGGADG